MPDTKWIMTVNPRKNQPAKLQVGDVVHLATNYNWIYQIVGLNKQGIAQLIHLDSSFKSDPAGHDHVENLQLSSWRPPDTEWWKTAPGGLLVRALDFHGVLREADINYRRWIEGSNTRLSILLPNIELNTPERREP